MLAPGIAKSLFKGKRVYIWLVIPILYMLFTCFQASAVYNIKLFAYHTNPFAGEDGWEITKVGYIFIHGQGGRLVNRKATRLTTFFWPSKIEKFIKNPLIFCCIFLPKATRLPKFDPPAAMGMGRPLAQVY